MDVAEFRDYCLGKPGVDEDTPFGPDTLVFKVGGKLFALTGIEEFDFINLKCDPERAVTLREQHPAIRPGWHMNKKHWNSVFPNELGDDRLFFELVDHSYELVKASLPKKVQQQLA